MVLSLFNLWWWSWTFNTFKFFNKQFSIRWNKWKESIKRITISIFLICQIDLCFWTKKEEENNLNLIKENELIFFSFVYLNELSFRFSSTNSEKNFIWKRKNFKSLLNRKSLFQTINKRKCLFLLFFFFWILIKKKKLIDSDLKWKNEQKKTWRKWKRKEKWSIFCQSIIEISVCS